MAPYLWALPFTHLSPHTCLVLDAGSPDAPNVVGYVVGCPDVLALAAAYPRYVADVLQSPQGKADVSPPPPQLDSLEPWWLEARDESGTRTRTRTRMPNPACLAQLAHSARWLLLDGVEGRSDLARAYRALLHVDLLDGWRGAGWGRRLVEGFVAAVRRAAGAGAGAGASSTSTTSKGAPDYGRGIHIGVAGENAGVVGFYEKVGFRVYPGGEREGNVWMVRDL